MTGNHLLLYRLVELMLQHEQNILTVDLLFDDEQIGDFVKSIQIDSPYQQMLLEGVLTESVRDEKLYVSFTVEGYFHYVLGEVIYNRTEGLGPEALKQIVEENKLNGAKEGVEQCLIMQIELGFNDVLFKLIDVGETILKYCTKPLSYLILKEYSIKNLLDPSFKIEANKLKSVLNKLMENSTENDYLVLFNSINYLQQIQKNKCLVVLYNILSSIEKYESLNYIKILLIGTAFIDQNRKIEVLEIIESEVEKFSHKKEYPEFIFELGTQHLILTNFEKAIALFEKSKEIFYSYDGDYSDKFEKIYSNLGSVYWYTGNLEKMRQCYEAAYKLSIKLYGESHQSTALGLHNLALINVMEEDYNESIIIFKKSLDITLRICGNVHPDTARGYSNLGSAYLRLSEIKKAFDLFNMALTIDKQVFHEFHPNLGLDYDDLGDVFSKDGDFSKAKEYYEISRSIFLNNYGTEYSHVKLLDEKIKELNDL
jgi:tetratricopeptide (TPR) repeat protein